MVVCALACCVASPALASAPTVTISGSARDGYSPDSVSAVASVDATLSKGVATGTLETLGRLGSGVFREFNGSVTCMVVEGARVTIGALGKDREEPTEGPSKALPGEFAQLLTVEFGEYTDPGQEHSPTYTDAFGNMLGEHDEGVESSEAPDCGEAGALSPGYLPTFGGVIHLSPSIASPEDGAVSESGTVTLSGTAEPSSSIWVYEEGEEPEEGTLVSVNAEGAWSLTLEGLAIGEHVFSAKAKSGSAVVSNTVEVEVLAPRPSTPEGGGPPKAGGGTPEGGGAPKAGGGTPGGGDAGQQQSQQSGEDAQTSSTSSQPGLQAVLGSREGGAGVPVPAAVLAGDELRVGRSGVLVLHVSCPAGESRCIGTVALQALGAVQGDRAGRRRGGARPLALPGETFDVAGGQTQAIDLRLPARTRALLARRSRWQAQATLVAHDPAGASHTTRTTVALLLAAADRR